MGEIGATLKKAREGKGLSFEEVYAKTRIHPRVLEALEEGRSEFSLSRTHVKGFLRNYAAFLGLDAETLVREYLQGIPPNQVLADFAYRFEPSEEEEGKKLPSWTRKVLAAIVLLGVLTAAGHGLSKINWSGKDFFGRYPPAARDGFQTFDRQIPGKDPLQLKISAKVNAWIVVKADDRLVYQGLMTAGQQESWSAQKNFALSLGDGGTVLLELNRRRLGVPGEKGKALEGLVITHEGIGIEKPL